MMPYQSPFSSVLIYGMGMMGASLAAAFRANAGSQLKIAGVVRSEKSERYIREHNLADTVFRLSSHASFADIEIESYDCIIIGLPVRSAARAILEFPAYAGILTDMSSTRTEIWRAAEKRPDLRFIGSHPMCGSEDTGPAAYRKDLFQKRLCIITGGENYPEEAASIRQLWQCIGMDIFNLPATEHDHILARLSHGPHIISGILALWARKNDLVEHSLRVSPQPLTGGGFKDMSRIAGSNPEMWTDILQTNKDNLIACLEDFMKESESTIAILRRGDETEIRKWFAAARLARNQLCGYSEDA